MFKAEIIGKVPYGLTHNDVHATILSVANERVRPQSVVKRRLAGNHVSVIVAFESESRETARKEARYMASSVLGFSADVIIREV